MQVNDIHAADFVNGNASGLQTAEYTMKCVADKPVTAAPETVPETAPETVSETVSETATPISPATGDLVTVFAVLSAMFSISGVRIINFIKKKNKI